MHFTGATQPPFGATDMVYIHDMERRGNEWKKPAAGWFAGFWLVSVAAGCGPIQATPEARARDFIEALVTSPSELEQLRDIARLAPRQRPEELLEDLSARVGLDYLRAMQAREVDLSFVQGETRSLGEGRQTVKVHVTFFRPGTPATGEVRFLVRFDREGRDRWRIARVTGDN